MEVMNLLVLLTVILLIMLYRNEIVHSCRVKAIDIISAQAKQDIENNEEWKKRYEKYDSYGSYNKMMFSFSKWRFKDFYPGIEE